MRFEDLGFFDQIALLQTIHKKLNQGLFESKLVTCTIDIQNLNKNGSDLVAARFFYPTKDRPEQIVFSHEFIDLVIVAPTQREQVKLLTRVMLHEMTHQYCALIDVEDYNHGDLWAEIAFDHGLETCYIDGQKYDDDQLDYAPLAIANRIRIRHYKLKKEYPSLFIPGSSLCISEN